MKESNKLTRYFFTLISILVCISSPFVFDVTNKWMFPIMLIPSLTLMFTGFNGR